MRHASCRATSRTHSMTRAAFRILIAVLVGSTLELGVTAHAEHRRAIRRLATPLRSHRTRLPPTPLALDAATTDVVGSTAPPATTTAAKRAASRSRRSTRRTRREQAALTEKDDSQTAHGDDAAAGREAAGRGDAPRRRGGARDAHRSGRGRAPGCRTAPLSASQPRRVRADRFAICSASRSTSTRFFLPTRRAPASTTSPTSRCHPPR